MNIEGHVSIMLCFRNPWRFAIRSDEIVAYLRCKVESGQRITL